MCVVLRCSSIPCCTLFVFYMNVSHHRCKIRTIIYKNVLKSVVLFKLFIRYGHSDNTGKYYNMPEAHKTAAKIFIAHKLSEVLNRSLVECPISCLTPWHQGNMPVCSSGSRGVGITHMLWRVRNNITHLLSVLPQTIPSSQISLKSVYILSHHTQVHVWFTYKKKKIFKAAATLFHVKIWVEKCQDVTNEHKWGSMENLAVYGYSTILIIYSLSAFGANQSSWWYIIMWHMNVPPPVYIFVFSHTRSVSWVLKKCFLNKTIRAMNKQI